MGRSVAAAIIATLLIGACQSTVLPTPPSVVASPSPAAVATSEASAPPEPVAGGCGATQVFAGPGPDARLGLADNAWAPASPASAGIVAYFWHAPPNIVHAHGPDGGDKVLWISHGDQTGRLSIAAHPFEASSPVVLFDFPAASSPSGNYPSGIDLPSPGCWHLDLALGSAHATIDLMVAPSGQPLASETPAAAVTVDHPTAAVTPSSDLQDYEIVDVEVTGFGVGGKVLLSECSSAAVATSLGCGSELAAQTLLVTGDDRAGSAGFQVSTKASDGPGRPSLRPCTDQCVIVATLGAGLPFVIAPIRFGGPAVDVAGTFAGGGVWAATADRLGISVDGGRSWSYRALPRFATVDVLDRTHVWVVSPGPGSVWPYGGQGSFDTLHLIVRRSTDGGRTWRSVALPGNFGGTTPVLAFADARHGYLLCAGERGGGASVLLRTDDGGATWRTVRSPGVTLGSVFSASGVGVLWSGTQGDAGPVERPVLDVSRDAGRTWTDARLPGLVGSLFATNTVLAPPAFFGSVGIVAVEYEPTDGQALAIYRSVDSGHVWRRAATVAEPNGASAFVAMDATHWLIATGDGLRRTADGGRTWSSFTPKGLPGSLITWLQFSDPRHGAALVSGGAHTTPADLFVTIDGGATWTATPTL